MLKKTKLFIGFCLFIGICGSAVHAQTINAASCNPSDVQRALNSVNQATATIVIPSGTCSWSSKLSYTVPSSVTSLTIQGQTTVNCTGTAGTSSYSCTPTDNTVLIDSYNASNQPLMNITIGTAAFRLTGITFQGGTISYSKPNGFLVLSGSTTSFRVDHCNFNTIVSTYDSAGGGGGMTIFGTLTGVVDHSTFEMFSENNAIRDFAGAGDMGNSAWAQPTQLGSSNFLFAENDIFQYGAANDCNYGGRMVIRYSTIEARPNDPVHDTGLWQGHSMGQGDPNSRGCRVLEIYHNYIFNPVPSNAMYSAGDGSSGTSVDWGNTIASGYNYDIVFQTDRELATGHSQSAPPAGWGYCGSNSSGVTSPWDGNSIATTGWPCIDQTGRGEGDLLSGSIQQQNVTNTTTGTESWPHNKLEPWYVWDETVSKQIYNAPGWNSVAMNANLDFFVQCGSVNPTCTGSFDGTKGVGTGTLTPTTSAAYTNAPNCTPGPGGTYGTSPTGSYGVGYWDSTTQTLYVCTSTNTWTAIYTPYAYPHPLVAGRAVGNSNGPEPPTSVSAAVQ